MKVALEQHKMQKDNFGGKSYFVRMDDSVSCPPPFLHCFSSLPIPLSILSSHPCSSLIKTSFPSNFQHNSVIKFLALNFKSGEKKMSLVSKHKISRKKATVMANLQVHPWTNLKAGVL